jgi:hypothetical protein
MESSRTGPGGPRPVVSRDQTKLVPKPAVGVMAYHLFFYFIPFYF